MKFMMTLDDRIYRQLEKFAAKNGVTVQQFLRGRVVPDWMAKEKETNGK